MGMHNCSLTEQEMKWLYQQSLKVTYSKGETIIKQGTFATHVLLLESGLTKIVIESENKKRMAVEVVTPSSFIGLPFLHPEYFRFTVEAMKETILRQIRRDVYSEMMLTRETTGQRFMDGYGEYYSQLLHKLEINSTRNNHGKLAHVLITLYEDTYYEEEIFRHLTRRDLSELAAISRESTNKILKELRHDRIIDITREGIELKQPDLLRRLSMIG